LKILWYFEDHTKFEEFAAILRDHSISYETEPDSKIGKAKDKITLSVEEKNYEKAKKLLLKHRKRRISSDLN